MFKRLFASGSSRDKGSAYAEGEVLFNAGVLCASRFECDEAIALYTRSIAVHETGAPYMNRANLLSKRIRYHEAWQDLQRAVQLDREQGIEPTLELLHLVTLVKSRAALYGTGMRGKLIQELRKSGVLEMAIAILCSSFEIESDEWSSNTFDRALIEYHFYNELDNIQKFESAGYYREVRRILAEYPDEFVQEKVDDCPDGSAYTGMEEKLHQMLCCFDPADMRAVREAIICEIHERLLDLDWGASRRPATSGGPSITKDAFIYLDGDLSDFADEEELYVGPFRLLGPTDDRLTQARLVTDITGGLVERLESDRVAYNYIMEEAEILSGGGLLRANVLRDLGFRPIEYEGKTVRNMMRDPGNRGGTDYLDHEIGPDLERTFGADGAGDIRVMVLSNFVQHNLRAVTEIRTKYAAHFRDQSDTLEAKAQWGRLLAELG